MFTLQNNVNCLADLAVIRKPNTFIILTRGN